MKVNALFPVAAIVALLCISLLPVDALPDVVDISVRNWDGRLVSFYYVYGDRISWWQGGAKFIFKPGTPEYEAVEELFTALPGDIGIKVVQGELRLVAAQLRAEYAFRGIIAFKDFVFVDAQGGLVIIDFEYGKSLNVTVYAQAAINMTGSSISGYGKADWAWKQVNPSVKQLIREPVASIPAGSEVLVAPSQGILESHNWRGYNSYLGGGPDLHRADCSRTVSASQIFWDREPDYWLVFDERGLAEMYLVDNWFNEAVLIWPVPHEVIVVSARQP